MISGSSWAAKADAVAEEKSLKQKPGLTRPALPLRWRAAAAETQQSWRRWEGWGAEGVMMVRKTIAADVSGGWYLQRLYAGGWVERVDLRERMTRD